MAKKHHENLKARYYLYSALHMRKLSIHCTPLLPPLGHCYRGLSFVAVYGVHAKMIPQNGLSVVPSKFMHDHKITGYFHQDEFC